LLFPTMTFAVFFLIVMPISWKLRDRPVPWRLFVFAASCVFYAWWDWRFLFLLWASIVGNTIAGWVIHRARHDRSRRIALIAGVSFNLGLLGFFKYWNFFTETLVAALRPLGLAPTALLIEVGLPVAISFYTFCALSYIIDIYRGSLRPAPLLDIAVYLAFFPHLVAGPIVRGSEFLPQLDRLPNPNAVDATRAARLIARGLVKKVVIANYLAQVIVDPVFGSPASYRSWDLLVAAYGYAVQIYADFSGYTDIAIGTALLLGIKFPDNFDRPYTAVTIQEFWRRWHMTLSRWLRDYLYIPLGGNQHGRRRQYRNLIITMALGGLWHGAAWTFVLWGLYHGIGLAAERYGMERVRRPLAERSPRVERLREQLGLDSSHGTVATVDEPVERRRNPWLGRLFVFHFVTLGWILFRSTSLSEAGTYLGRLVTAFGSTGIVTPMVVIAIVVAVGAQFIPPRVGLTLEWRASRLPPLVQALGFALVLLICNVLGPQGVAPFIYFQF
jgi:alginate O-acetyltransferase complex protein AlgI